MREFIKTIKHKFWWYFLATKAPDGRRYAKAAKNEYFDGPKQ